jgi:antitoxin (DNA-binding transcriptional repressor) of toxin-antitoxin stability system
MPIQSVGAYEAKTHLPKLLREVQAGMTFEISVRGQVVALLSPVSSEQRQEVASANMHAFMSAQQRSGAGADINLRELIDEGRA